MLYWVPPSHSQEAAKQQQTAQDYLPGNKDEYCYHIHQQAGLLHSYPTQEANTGLKLGGGGRESVYSRLHAVPEETAAPKMNCSSGASFWVGL